MMTERTITLGGKSFAIGQMRLKQLKRALPVLTSINLANIAGELDKMVEVIQIAMSVDHPDTDVEELSATLIEVAMALEVIMGVNGFERKVPEPGEAQARAS